MADKATVLIVDDDELVRATFVRVLERGGFETREAFDGVEGLRAFREAKPDCVLLDLRMPGMDGLDVLRTLVAESPETPVLVASGAGTMRDAVEALRRGAWDFVLKPVYDPQLLIHSIERAVEKAGLLLQNKEYARTLEQANRTLARALAELRSDQQGARVLQFQLLPRDGLRLGPYVTSRRLFPSQVLSGDFVDYFPIGNRFAGLYVADVSGHGAASAFVTAILTTLMGRYRQAFAIAGDETVLDPGRLLEKLHTDIHGLVHEKHVSMFYAALDLEGGHLRYANAGLYPFPLVQEPGGEAVTLNCPGRPLGLPGAGGPGIGARAFPLGSRLVVATDGVLELGDDGSSQRAKREHLLEVFAAAKNIDDFATRLGLGNGAPLRDDVAILYLGAGEEVQHG
jgi:sigma-B regulation protein RsbU (phosphoserine phosphatase)